MALRRNFSLLGAAPISNVRTPRPYNFVLLSCWKNFRSFSVLRIRWTVPLPIPSFWLISVMETSRSLSSTSSRIESALSSDVTRYLFSVFDLIFDFDGMVLMVKPSICMFRILKIYFAILNTKVKRNIHQVPSSSVLCSLELYRSSARLLRRTGCSQFLSDANKSQPGACSKGALQVVLLSFSGMYYPAILTRNRSSISCPP